MKRLYVILFGVLLVLAGVMSVLSSKVFAGEGHSLNFNNQTYTLKYSTNKTPSGEYINEYYKEGEQGENWSELITVCEYPGNNTPPLEFAETIQIKDHSPDGYERMLNRNRQFESVTFTFLMRRKTENTKYIEFNVMKVEPYKGKKGLKTIQYAKKYNYTNREEFLKALENIDKEKDTVFNEMKKTLMPPVVHETVGE